MLDVVAELFAFRIIRFGGLCRVYHRVGTSQKLRRRVCAVGPLQSSARLMLTPLGAVFPGLDGILL
jgi:hypothetical protein